MFVKFSCRLAFTASFPSHVVRVILNNEFYRADSKLFSVLSLTVTLTLRAVRLKKTAKTKVKLNSAAIGWEFPVIK